MLVLENFEESDWQLECGQLRQRGARLLASAQWADCSFLLGRERAPQKAHRLLLAMASPVFQAMFYGPLAERDAPIPLPDIQPEVFLLLLQYIYTDQINLDSYVLAIELYHAAQKYMLRRLQRLCTTYLSRNLSPLNACRIYEFAYFIGDRKLEFKSLKVIKAKTKQALSDSSFENLALGTVINIFSMDDITVDNELDLLDAAECYYLAQEKNLDEKSITNAPLPDVQPENDPKVTSDGNIRGNGVIENNDEEILMAHGDDSRQNEENKNVAVPDVQPESDPEVIPNENMNGIIENNNMISGNHSRRNKDVDNQETTIFADKSLTRIAIEKEDRARSEATFHFTVHNFKNLKEKVLSPPCYVRELPWQIMVKLGPSKKHPGYEQLGVFLQCNGVSKCSSWSCQATATLKIVPQHPEDKPFTKKIHKLFCSKEASEGFEDFMAWEEDDDDDETFYAYNIEYESFLQHDSITLEVHITAEEPIGIPLSMKKLEEMKDISIQTLVGQIRFLTLTANQLAQYKPKSSLLTEHDILALMMNITTSNTYMPLPVGFSRCRQCRNP